MWGEGGFLHFGTRLKQYGKGNIGMCQKSDNKGARERRENIHFREALIALPDELAQNIDQMSTFRRNAEAKELIRQCLEQYGQGDRYQSNGPSAPASN